MRCCVQIRCNRSQYEVADHQCECRLNCSGYRLDIYDISKLDNLGAGKIPNVISNMQMERLASPNGPTGGKILRPSDNKPAKNIAFVQCAGSRDENHLPYCSYICCMASMKQATYVREQYKDSKASISTSTCARRADTSSSTGR